MQNGSTLGERFDPSSFFLSLNAPYVEYHSTFDTVGDKT